MEKPLEKQVRKLGYEVEILAVVVAVAIIGIVYLLVSSYMPPLPGGGQQVQEDLTGVKSCTERNPTMTEEDCLNMDYIERAIEENDIEICEKITKDDLKEHCKNYFGYYRWD